MKTPSLACWPATASENSAGGLSYRARTFAIFLFSACTRREDTRGRLGLAGLLVLSTTFSLAQSTHPTEPEVEAAYLYNFGKFVSWPTDRVVATKQFEICILGKDPFGKVLDATVVGERIGGRTIKVRGLAQLPQAGSCSILFVSSSEETRLAPILASAHRLSLLTVSDVRHFAERGGVIGLLVHKDRVRFEVNRRAAERCHLQLSSELLKVAVRVIDQDTPEK
jgi:hypothetical protein